MHSQREQRRQRAWSCPPLPPSFRFSLDSLCAALLPLFHPLSCRARGKEGAAERAFRGERRAEKDRGALEARGHHSHTRNSIEHAQTNRQATVEADRALFPRLHFAPLHFARSTMSHAGAPTGLNTIPLPPAPVPPAVTAVSSGVRHTSNDTQKTTIGPARTRAGHRSRSVIVCVPLVLSLLLFSVSIPPFQASRSNRVPALRASRVARRREVALGSHPRHRRTGFAIL